jgi:uncharacterized protein (DUF608 family)
MKYIKKTYLCLALLIIAISTNAQMKSADWPVLKTYDQEHLQRIAMPIGGIGTGTVSLSGYGAIQDWEIMNRPAKGYNPHFGKFGVTKRAPFFALYVKEQNQQGQGLLLEGPLPERYAEGIMGAVGPNHGLARFAEATFKTAYPFGQVFLKDKDIPVEVTVGAFNPLIPGNTDDSSIPIAILSYKVKNTSDKPLTISVAGNIPNFIGSDGKVGKPIKNINTYKDENGLKGIHYTSNGVDKESPQWGTMSMTTNTVGKVSYRTNWVKPDWGNSTLDFWDDFTDDGQLEERPEYGTNNPMGSLAVTTTLAPNEEKDIRFYLTWDFPNRPDWKYKGNVGNYYSTKYEDSWDVAKQMMPRIPELEKSTLQFVNTFINSDIPKIVKEAALFNLSHFRTQLAFRTKKGYVLGWEGTRNDNGSGSGSCTHVWNYEQTVPYLFGDVAKTMREVEFDYATDDDGLMSFRVHLPLEERDKKSGKAAADGQLGCIMKYYREWQLSGDDEFLNKHWEKVKKALEFCWIPGGWDANKDGVMEGAQHNTMDVEYFGPNPQMGFWYLGALRATEEMASYLGEKKLAKTCRSLYENGSTWMDKNLFNGEYYEQQIVPLGSKENVAEGLIRVWWRVDLDNPKLQLGKGVLVDQLIGQVMAHTLGFGYLSKKENIQKTHESILKYNYRDNLLKHNNVMRSYAFGDESALLMAAYPNKRPEFPFPYFSEVMTGFEYTAAVGMLYEGLEEEGLKTMSDVRNRYDGKKRNPFNEAEFGNHYARSMMAWGGILASTGFHYSGVDKSISFTSKPGTYFWSNGYSWGTCEVKANEALLTVLSGKLELDSFALEGREIKKMKNKTISVNEMLKIKL